MTANALVGSSGDRQAGRAANINNSCHHILDKHELEEEEQDDEEDVEGATGAFKKGYAVVTHLIALIPAKASDTPRQMWGDEWSA